MVAAIRYAQEVYRSENAAYANISPTLDATYPSATPHVGISTLWGAPCGSQCNGPPSPTWVDLLVHVDGPVVFGYATTAGAAGTTPRPREITVKGRRRAFPDPSPSDWFIVAARLEDCRVYAASWTSDVDVDCEVE